MKNINNNIQKKCSAKKRDVKPEKKITHWLEEYTSIYGVKGKPVTESFIETLAHDYVQWATNTSDAFRITMFYVNKGIPRRTFEDWVKKYPILKQAHEHVLDVIAHRREELAIKANPNNALRMLPFYDNEWKLMEEWRSKMKTDNEKSEKTVIVMDRFEYDSKKEGL